MSVRRWTLRRARQCDGKQRRQKKIADQTAIVDQRRLTIVCWKGVTLWCGLEDSWWMMTWFGGKDASMSVAGEAGESHVQLNQTNGPNITSMRQRRVCSLLSRCLCCCFLIELASSAVVAISVTHPRFCSVTAGYVRWAQPSSEEDKR